MNTYFVKNKCERGIALITALMTLTLCLILIAFMIRLAGYHKTFQNRREAAFRARMAAWSGVEYAKAQLSGISNFQHIQDLDGVKKLMSDQQSFALKVEMKLGYLWVRSVGSSGSTLHVAEAYLGASPYSEAETALIVQQARHEMIASGKTKIIGNVWVPNGSIEARAAGQLPPAQNPIQGKVLKTPDVIHDIHPMLFPYAQDLLNQARRIQVGRSRLPVGPSWNLEGQTLKFENSLEIPSKLKAIHGPGILLVKGDILIPSPLILDRDIKIVATGSILSKGHLKLGGMLAAGLNLEIKGSASGYAVIVAGSLIDLSAGVRLQKPSQCGLLRFSGFESEKNQKRIYLRGGAFHGTLFSHDIMGEWTSPLILIEPGVDLRGYIYTQGSLELRSRFQGHITTGNLRSTRGAQVFDNWFKNLEIDRSRGEINWAMPPGFNRNMTVLEWVER